MDRKKVQKNKFLAVVITLSTFTFASCNENSNEKSVQNDSRVIGKEYANALATMPDWNGQWKMTGGTSHTHRLMFDPENVVIPEDPAGEIGGMNFGPLSGTHLVNMPYKPEYQKKYDEIVEGIKAGRNPDPVGACLQPHAMPRQMGGIPSGPEITVTPNMILMSWAPLGALRRIYLDGRSHPGTDVIPPNYIGHSTGYWEGDTLVVDTVGMLPGIYDQSGAPYSGEVHLIERIRLLENGMLEDEMTIEDPVMFERPWVVTRRYQRSENRYPDNAPYYCPPGTAVDFSDGYQKVILPWER